MITGSKILGLVVGIVISCQSIYANATQNHAIQWLEKMSLAIQSLNYEGTFVYLHNDQMESLHIVHGIDKTGEQQRIIALNGTEREILRNSKGTICIMPNAKSMIENMHSGKIFPALKHPTQLTNNYTLNLLKKDRVANRQSQVLLLKPQDSYRYGYRFWLAQNNGFPLRVELLDSHGKILEQTMFTSLKLYDTIPHQQLQLNINNRPYAKYKRATPINDGKPFVSHWHAKSLPQGYILQSQRQYGTTQQGEHLIYTDGLAFVSVYIEARSQNVLKGTSHIGAVHAYGKYQNQHQITAVGVVPAITVKNIAQAIHLKP